MRLMPYRDQFTADGVTTHYATTYEFLEKSTLVFINGILAKKGTTYNEGSDYKSIDFTAAEDSGYKIEIFYFYYESSTAIEALDRDPFTADGDTATFSTTYEFVPNSTLVFIDGVLSAKGSEYNEGSDHKSITFTTNPDDNAEIEVYYERYEPPTTSSTDELLDILNSALNIKRETSILLDGSSVAASMSVNRQPPRSCRLGVTLFGASPAAGTISIAGTTNENFVFTDNGVEIGEKDYTNISSITVAGISGGTVEIKAVTKTGQPVNQEKSIHTNLPVYFFAVSGKVRMSPGGQEKEVKYKFITLPNKTLKENDIFYAVAGIQGLTCGRLSFVEEIVDFDGATHHIEAEVLPL